jgi:hypothetical protein
MSANAISLGLLRAIAIGALMLGGFAISIRAQTPAPSPNIPPTAEGDKHESVEFGARENDARVRLALKAEKKAYEENLARAKEARDLADEVKKKYDLAKSLNAADQKKLERLEKLTRRIRNEVGGSSTNADAKELPKTFDEGVTQLADMTNELCDAVEKTPRRVVSASIIDQANKLIALIEFLRGTHD